MIFAADLAGKVLAGEKTQTRRPARLATLTPAAKHHGRAKLTFEPCRYVAGRSYAVQPGRGKRAVGRILVRSVEVVTVGAISLADARAEGFTSTTAFYDRWRELYGHTGGWCWRIEFELVGGRP